METIADRISREGPLKELDAVGWAIRLAKRIEALHALGVAHGSISPACLLTAAEDRSAKGILVDVRHTPSRLAYQSPERAGGGDISPADDVWAIAATLYEMLTGTPAFSGANDHELRQRIAAASPAPLAVFDVGDDDLQHIIDAAFQREPERRTRGAAALRKALEEWHPDLAVRSLSPLEDEDSTNDDDDDDVRTMMRAPVYEQPEPQRPSGPGPRPAAGQPAARPQTAPGAPGFGAPAAPPGHGAPASAPGYGAPAFGAPAASPGYGAPPSSGRGPAPGYGRGPVPAPAPGYGRGPAPDYGRGPAPARMEQPLPDDDDEDNAATRMREFPLQQVLDGGVLHNARAGSPVGPTQVGYPGAPAPGQDAPRVVAFGAGPVAPARPGGTQVGAAGMPGAAPPGRTLTDPRLADPRLGAPVPDSPLGQTLALDTGAPAGLPDAPWAQTPRPAAGQPAREPAPTFPDDDDDEDDVRTVMRDGADSPFASRPLRGGPEPAPMPGAFPQPGGGLPGAGFPGSPGNPGGYPGAAHPGGYPGAAQTGGGFPVGAPQPGPGGVLGPSTVDAFARGPRTDGQPGAPAFAQSGSGPAAPSPFAAPGGGFFIPEGPPPRSPWRAVLIVLLVAILVGAGMAFLAMRTGALGAAPRPAAPDALALTFVGSGRPDLGLAAPDALT